jgi:LEA14-like dessication related protein
MKKAIFTLIVIILILINLIVGAFLFADIRMIELPETTITIDLQEISTEELVLQVSLGVANPNDFTIRIDDLEIVTTTLQGTELDRFTLPGGGIPAHANRTFTAQDHITFDGELPEQLISSITGDISLVFLGLIKKSLSLNMHIVTRLDTIIDELAMPSITIMTDLSDISQEGVTITGAIHLQNHNPFNLSLTDLEVTMETNTGETPGFLNVTDGIIPSQDTLTLHMEGFLEMETLNAETFTITISGTVGATIANITKSLPLATTVEVQLPDLEDLFSSQVLTDVIIRGDFKATVKGILDTVELELQNPHKIDLVTTDIEVSIYRVDNNETHLLGRGKLGDEIFAANNTTILKGELLIPYSQFFQFNGFRLLPDYILVTVSGNVSIPGVDQSLWIGISGYQDFLLFR